MGALIKEEWTVANNTEIAAKLSDYFPTLKSIFDYQSTIISKGTQSEVMRFNIEDTGFYIKRYFRTKGLRSYIGHSRLRMEIRNQHRFIKWGLNAAPVIAYGERYRFSHTLNGALVTLAVDNSSNLEEISRNSPELFKNKAWLSEVIKQVAEMARILHDHRFCHNDLFLRNLLIQHNSDQPKLFLIDCPSGCFWFGTFLSKRKVKDIASLDKHASLYLSRTQRLRFLLYYRQSKRLTSRDKRFIRDLLAYSRRKNG